MCIASERCTPNTHSPLITPPLTLPLRPHKGALARLSQQAVSFHARAQQAKDAAVRLPALADLQVRVAAGLGGLVTIGVYNCARGPHSRPCLRHGTPLVPACHQSAARFACCCVAAPELSTHTSLEPSVWQEFEPGGGAELRRARAAVTIQQCWRRAKARQARRAAMTVLNGPAFT